MRKWSVCLSLFVATALAHAVRADVIMFDFGPTVATGDDQLNSPYHTINPLFTDTVWNQITADTLSGLLWSDGSAALEVSLNLGGSSDATTLNLGTAPSSSALGTSINSGVYTNTSVGRDGIFVGTSGQSRQVGLQLGGLAAGSYEIFLTGRNTSTSNSNSPTFRIGTTSASGNFNFSGYTSETLTYYPSGTSASTAGWVEAGGGTGVNGENYVRFQVDLNAGDYLNVVVSGSFGESRGFLNSMEISTIPEPSTLILMGCSLGALALYRRKRA